MSEKHIARPEHHSQHENLVSHEHHERMAKHHAELATRAAQEKAAQNIEKIKELAKTEALESHKVKTEEHAKNEADSMVGVQHSLKATAYARTLARVQQKLPKSSRIFSKFAHNPTVEKLSAVGAQTVARPSGILGGSICAFLGSVIVLYYSKHYGFEYSYTLLFVLFMGGFLVGAAIELSAWLLYGRKQRY